MGNIDSVDIIVLGTSYGGMETLTLLFSNLSEDFDIPIVIVYHRPRKSNSDYLVEYFSNCTDLVIEEISDCQKILSGHIYFAPPDYHVLFENKDTLILYMDKAVNHSRPSIDVLFQSGGQIYKNKIMGILLSGASSDGAKGICFISEQGGFSMVQEPSTAIASTMPQSAIDLCFPDRVEDVKMIAFLMNESNAEYRKRK